MNRKNHAAPEEPLNRPYFIQATELKEDDCFGIMWNPSDRVCSACAAKLHCGIIFSQSLREDTRKMAKEAGGYLDETSFDLFDQSQFVAEVILSPGKYTIDWLFDHLAELSQCPDEDTIAYYIKSMIADHPIKTVNRKFYPKNYDTSSN